MKIIDVKISSEQFTNLDNKTTNYIVLNKEDNENYGIEKGDLLKLSSAIFYGGYLSNSNFEKMTMKNYYKVSYIDKIKDFYIYTLKEVQIVEC